MSELGTVTAILRADISDFASKMAAATTQLQALDKAADATSKSLDPIGKKSKDLSRDLDDYAESTRKAKNQTNGYQRALDKAGGASTRAVAPIAATTAAYDGLGRSLDDSDRKIRASGEQFEKAEKRYGSGARSISQVGKIMSLGITLPVAVASGVSLKLAGDFDSAMAQVGYAMRGTGADMNSFSDLAMKMGKETQFSALEAGNSLLALAKGGMTEADIKGGALAQTLNLAAAGGVELEDAANVMVAAMTTFGLKGTDAGRVADSIGGAANVSAAGVTDLGEGLKYAGNMASTVGYTLEDTTAVLAALGDQGQRGSVAGVSMRQMFSSMLAPTVKAKAVMKDLGLTFLDNNGKIKDSVTLSGDLNKALKGKSDAEKGAALETLFGVRGMTAALAIMRANVDGMKKYTAATHEVGNAQGMAAARMAGWKGTWEKFTGSLETAGIKLGQAIIPGATKVVDKLGEMADAFTNLPQSTQSAIGGVALLAASLGPLVWMGGKIAGLTSGIAGGGSAILGVLNGTAAASAGLAGASAGVLMFAGALAAVGSAVSLFGAKVALDGKAEGWAREFGFLASTLNMAWGSIVAIKGAFDTTNMSGEGLNQQIRDTGITVGEMNAAMDGSTENLDNVTRSMSAMAGTNVMSAVNQFEAFPKAVRESLAGNDAFTKSLRASGLIIDTTTGRIRMLTEAETAMANGFVKGWTPAETAMNMTRLGEVVQGLDVKTRSVISTSLVMQESLLGVGRNAKEGGDSVRGYVKDVARMGIEQGLTVGQMKKTFEGLGLNQKDMKFAMRVTGLEKTKSSLDSVGKDIDATKSKLSDLSKKPQTLKVKAETAKAQADLKKLEAEHRRLLEKKKELEIKLKIKPPPGDPAAAWVKSWPDIQPKVEPMTPPLNEGETYTAGWGNIHPIVDPVLPPPGQAAAWAAGWKDIHPTVEPAVPTLNPNEWLKPFESLQPTITPKINASVGEGAAWSKSWRDIQPKVTPKTPPVNEGAKWSSGWKSKNVKVTASTPKAAEAARWTNGWKNKSVRVSAKTPKAGEGAKWAAGWKSKNVKVTATTPKANVGASWAKSWKDTKFTVTADTASAATSVNEITTLLATLSATQTNPPITAQDNASGVIGSVSGQLAALDGRTATTYITTIERTEKRAKGGPVGRSLPYLVGEEGPELFFPGQSARSASRMGTGRYQDSDTYPTLLGVNGPTMFFPRTDGEVIPADKTAQMLAEGMPIAGALKSGGSVTARKASSKGKGKGRGKPAPPPPPDPPEVQTAVSEFWRDRKESAVAEKKNKTKKKGKSSGKGDAWLLRRQKLRELIEEGIQAAKQAREEIAEMQANLIEEMAQIRDGLTSNLLSSIQSDNDASSSGGGSGGGIGGAYYMGGGAGGASGGGGGGGGGGFAGGISNFLRQITDFYNDLKELAAKGLPLGLLGQLIQMGVVQGGAAAKELMSADIPKISDEWSQIVAISNSISTDANLVGGPGSTNKAGLGGLMSPSYDAIRDKQDKYNAMPYKAIGGSVMEGMPYIVGEKGPELFRPKTSGEIIPAGRTQRMLKSGAWRGATVGGGTPVSQQGIQAPRRGGVAAAGGDGPTHVHLHIDGKKVHEAVVKSSKIYELRNGTTQLTPTLRG